jgi:DnaJ-class molecular chaperone
MEEKIIGYQPCSFCKGKGRKEPTGQVCEACKGTGQMPIYEKKPT